MSGHHYIADADLLRRIHGDQRAEIERWLAAQRTAPLLVGTTAAARILGIRPPHVSRLRDQGRMPDPIPVEGSVDVYVQEEIEELAKALAEERAARAARKAVAK